MLFLRELWRKTSNFWRFWLNQAAKKKFRDRLLGPLRFSIVVESVHLFEEEKRY